MTTICLRMKKSSSSAGRQGSVYVQLIHHRSTKKIFTQTYLYPDEWDNKAGRVLYNKVPETNQKRLKELQGIEKRLEGIVGEVNICIQILQARGEFTTNEVTEIYTQGLHTGTLKPYVEYKSQELKAKGNERTAEAYISTLNSVMAFNEGRDLPMAQINGSFLKNYENHLYRHTNKENTVSFYMRMLRSMQNQAADEGLTEAPSAKLYRSVFTGVAQTRKRAVDQEVIRQIAEADLADDPALDFARDMFMFSFYTRGMSFIDIAHLKKEALKEKELTYIRMKCGQKLTIGMNAPLAALIEKYRVKTANEPYLLPILNSENPNIRKQYKTAIHTENVRLKRLSKRLGLSVVVTTYVARHSWATIARDKEIALLVISEGLGHRSEDTTRIYLASFDISVINQANDLVITL